MVQRVIRGIEVTEETLSVEVIKDVALGVGHYLGHAQTLDRMQSEFLYPKIADRAPPGVWEQEGSKDILERAHETAFEILSTHFPDHITPKADTNIRDRFPILLSRDAMKPSARCKKG